MIGNANVAWTEAARRAGLALHVWQEPFQPHACFRAHKRALGPVSQTPGSSCAMYGRVAPNEAEPAGLETIGAVEWKNDEWSSTTHTYLYARVDPPLFLGLSVRASPIAGPVAAYPIAHHGAQGRGFMLRSWAPERAHAIVAGPGGSEPALLDAVVAMSGDVFLTDSAAACRLPGVVGDGVLVRGTLEQLAWIARELSWRGQRRPPEPGERAQQYAWASFASHAGFSFDEARMEMAGAVHGAQVKLALESEPGLVYTVVMVTFPSALGLALRVTKKKAMTGVLAAFGGSPDLPTGDPGFDRTFYVTGQHAVAVQQLFWSRRALKAALLDLGLYASEVLLNDTSLAVRFPQAFASEVELAKILDRVGVVVGELFGAAGAVGPYR